MEIQTKEVQIILVIKAIQISQKLNQYSIAKIYKVLFSIFSNRIAGRIYYTKTKANSLKLTKLEEEVICRNILELDSRRFVPWFTSIENIVNYILELQGGKCIRIY